MIILDGPSDPQKRRLSRRSNASEYEVESLRSSDVAPPSYRSNTSGDSLQPMLDADPPHSPFPPTTKVQRAWPRFRTALLYALAIYAVTTIAIAVPYIVTQNKKTSTHIPYQRIRPPDPALVPGDPDGNTMMHRTIPSTDGSVLGCDVWDYSHGYGYPDDMTYSRLTYCIPHNTTEIWLHALGGGERFVSGDLVVKLNPDDDETDYMVDVMLTYPTVDTAALYSSSICLMKANDTWGVGIYTPPNSANHSLDYKLTFLVPQRPKNRPLELSKFTTYLPWFYHTFQDLGSSLNFSSVEVGGVASSVNGIIQADTVNITTSQAAITGTYRATDTLILQTSNAKIDANITLTNKGGQGNTTSLYMKSSNGPFYATVNLSTSGVENATATYRNGSLPQLPQLPQYRTWVSCDDSPVTLILRHDDRVNASDLDLQVNTTLNRAVILLDSKFDGNFDLHAKNGSVIVRDLDGIGFEAPEMFMNHLPLHPRSLIYERDSASRIRGCVKRGIVPRDPNEKVNVKIQNHLGLIALGFVKPNDESPVLSDIGLT